jgi:hypothetical protein
VTTLNLDSVSDALGGWLGVVVLVWLVSAFLASVVAPRKRRIEFLIITLVILGPLGVGFAAVAQPRDPSTPGRDLYMCPRCGARQFVPSDETEFDCWRCDQHCAVRTGTLRRKSAEAASQPQTQTPKVASRSATAGAHSAKPRAASWAGFEEGVGREHSQAGAAGPSSAANEAPPVPWGASPSSATSEAPPVPWEAFPGSHTGGGGAGPTR